MAGPPPRYEPDTTPKQPTASSQGQQEATDGDHASDRIESWDVWGQRPEPGNPSADLRPGALSNKAFKRAILVPFPDAMPFRIKPNPRHGGDSRGEGQP